MNVSCKQNVPPMIQGVSPSRLVLPVSDCQTVFEYFCQTFSHILEDEWRARFEEGLVMTNQQKLSVNSPYHVGETVYYYRFVKDEVAVPFDYQVIFENEHILVVDKPHFLTVSPAGNYVKETLLTRLKHDFDNEHISPAHRLDRETAGVMLFTKHPSVRDVYQKIFREYQKYDLKKVYHAIAPTSDQDFPCEVWLHLVRGEPFYVMQVLDKAPNTQTHIEVLEVRGHWTKYQLTPTTGKLHQLRVHMNHLDIPIKNDPYYPVVVHRASDDFANPLQLLAKSISFIDPISGEHCEFCSKLKLEF